MAAQKGDIIYAERLGVPGTHSIEEVLKKQDFIFPLAGQFLMDPNEWNGWGPIGPYDNTNSQDLGNVGAATINRNAGGILWPYPMRLKRMFVEHYNSNGNALAWGWRAGYFQPNHGATTLPAVTDIVNEVAENGGVAPRDYGNNRPQVTEIDIPNGVVIPADHTVVLGVEAPTAVGTNYYVRIKAGYMQFEMV